ncbi:hypothetical protein GCK32_004592 [Trichostrongylus colubriformis]|uniref:Uncharacterized protein n=1 Tax=Trichostrongylus colubriformis TaxID=6319 RepID=A0AAN8G5T5_TRICO
MASCAYTGFVPRLRGNRRNRGNLGCDSGLHGYTSLHDFPDSLINTGQLFFLALEKISTNALISTAPNVFELARNRLRLEPSSYLFIEAKFLYANLGIFDSPKLIGYAMPVYSHTLPMIGKWLNSDGMETKRQLAFEMPVCFSSKVFSARDVIIDLPGTACLVDSVPRPIPSSNGDSPVDEADADTKTAVLFTMDKDVVCNVSDTAENRGCWLTDLISSNYTAISTKMSSASQVRKYYHNFL